MAKVFLVVPVKYAGEHVNIWWQNHIEFKELASLQTHMFYEFKTVKDLIDAYDITMLSVAVDEYGLGVDVDRLTKRQPVKGVS